MNWNRHTADIHGLPAARAAKLAAGFVVLALIVSACGPIGLSRRQTRSAFISCA